MHFLFVGLKIRQFDIMIRRIVISIEIFDRVLRYKKTYFRLEKVE